MIERITCENFQGDPFTSLLSMFFNLFESCEEIIDFFLKEHEFFYKKFLKILFKYIVTYWIFLYFYILYRICNLRIRTIFLHAKIIFIITLFILYPVREIILHKEFFERRYRLSLINKLLIEGRYHKNSY